MKSKDFLFSMLAGGENGQIKGSNPNKSSKIITSTKAKPIKSIKKISQPKVQQSEDQASQKQQKPDPKKSSILNQIQKYQKKINSINQNIQETNKKLDVDLFLKKQKQKRNQYAKDLDKQYEEQKKLREQKLYKKYRKGQDDQEQTKNVRTAIPFQIFKILDSQKNSISKTISVVNDHIGFTQLLKDGKKDEIFDNERILRQQTELLFPTDQYSTGSIKKIAQDMRQIITFPIDIESGTLEPSEQYEHLMNALTLMPKHLSEKYYSTQKVADIDYYSCKLFFNGIRKTVVTNDTIQTKQFAHRHLNVMSKVNGNKNFGPTLIQKCFRKVSSNLQNAGLRQSLFTLFGLYAEIIPITNKNYIKQNFEPIMKFLTDSGQIVAFMNDNHNENIYQNRLYQLKQVMTAVQFAQLDQQKVIQKDFKKKKNKKKDEKIEQQLHKNKVYKTLYHFNNPWKGLILDTKGLNKFQLLQTFEKFNQMILIRQYPKSWICKRINVELFSTGPISITSNQWTKNNQYQFNISAQVNVRVTMLKHLSSKNQSILNKDTSPQVDYENNNLYGFMIFKVKQGEQKITCIKMDQLICQTKSNEIIDAASFCGNLGKGNYIIVPYSNKITQNAYQYFNLDFFVQKQESISFVKVILTDWKWVTKNAQTTDQKIIQSLQSKQIIKKVITQDIEMNRVSTPNVNILKAFKVLQDTNLIMPKDLKLNDVLIPGKLTRFLINPDLITQQGKKTSIKTGSKIKSSKKLNPQISIQNGTQIQAYEKQEALKILLGYDILQGQDINRGLMADQIQQNQDVLDFEHFGLGKDGLTAIMETLMTYPSITKLNLADNDLDDSCIVFLCYYLDKGNRTELTELNLKSNCFGKIGIKAIKGLMARFQKLNVFY